MRLQIMCLRDAKIEAFIQPFFAQSVGAAIRAVSDIVNDSNDPPAKHPEDFSLWCMGIWDDAGVFELEKPTCVAECSNLKTAKLEVMR